MGKPILYKIECYTANTLGTMCGFLWSCLPEWYKLRDKKYYKIVKQRNKI